MNDQELKFAVEALLFASEKPLRVEEIQQAFSAPGTDPSSGGDETADVAAIRASLEALKADYELQGRGFRLFEIAGGYQLVSDPRFEAHLKRFYQARLKKRLSQATLETLAIIAYRQPVTRADMEFVRGVNVDGALKTLLEKGLVKIVGKKEVPGRPLLYGTTQDFLEHFGLSSLKDLPPLTEFTLKDIEPHLLPPDMIPPPEGGGMKAAGEIAPAETEEAPSEERAAE